MWDTQKTLTFQVSKHSVVITGEKRGEGRFLRLQPFFSKILYSLTVTFHRHMKMTLLKNSLKL